MILRIGYRKFIDLAGPLFLLMVFLFVVLLAIGYTTKGAQSWFNFGIMRFQPSEIGKVVLALVLAQICSKTPPTDIRGISAAVGFAGIMSDPLLQPASGGCYSVMLAVLIAAGAPVKFLSGTVISLLAMLPAAWAFTQTVQ